jgi:outer membrane protein assembly factor BamB
VCFADAEVNALRLNAAFKEDQVWNGLVSGDVIGSPLVHENTVFITTSDGELFEFDAHRKGPQEPLSEGRALFANAAAAGPAAYASLTLAGNCLFLNSTKGETVVLEATRGAQLVSRNHLPAGTGSSPIFSGKDMFLRDGAKLFCIGQ